MADKLLRELKIRYELVELDAGEFSSLMANGMRFDVKAYRAEELGHVSVMKAKGFFGLMKMDTLMIVPQNKDLPLYSYDRIYAMGNDVLIVELYDTLVEKLDASALENVKNEFSDIEERDAGEHWYDSIKLAQSISKKGKKAQSARLDDMALKHFSAYLDLDAPRVSDEKKKNELSAHSVNGLLENGGPSTDVFKKSIGEAKTRELFESILFGTK